jgi:hypothetical protein
MGLKKMTKQIISTAMEKAYKSVQETRCKRNQKISDAVV